MALRLDLVQPDRGRAVLACGGLGAVAGQPPMGAGADADIVLIGPIEAVVRALEGRGGGVVADLVACEAGRAQMLPGPMVEISGFVVFLGADDALARKLLEDAASRVAK